MRAEGGAEVESVMGAGFVFEDGLLRRFTVAGILDGYLEALAFGIEDGVGGVNRAVIERAESERQGNGLH